jgi:glutaminyl-tRNA synthetase
MKETPHRTNFLTEIIEADLKVGKNDGQVVTRFPPEPNGFLHIGHAKSIFVNFGIAQQYHGRAHLRFDDTNPNTEDPAYVEAIEKDVRWLGFDWGTNLHYASDYFEPMYACAVRLIQEGKAYVDSQSIEEIRQRRGSFDRVGTNSPFRNRSVEENLTLFLAMRQGELAEGAAVLRGKIDMSHSNLLMRDPLLYRIRNAPHHRTGNKWCIYPMYDFAHPLEDAFEGITHSFCTLEFESNRELYDWVLDNLGPWNPRPRQFEFARLALGYTVMSKRKLLELVDEKHVSGWDDPRMPTLAGMRRRGVTPEALRDFAEMIGVAKNNSLVDIGKFEFAVRNDLEQRAPKAMAVIDPLRITLTNWPQGVTDELEIAWWPGQPEKAGTRKVPFGSEMLIEREDFAENPPKGWKRLSPGGSVKLIGAFVIRCQEVVRGPGGEIVELRCSYDPSSRGGTAAEGQKGLGALHWVHARRSMPAEMRLYDRLFTVEQPDADGDFLKHLNPDSLTIAQGARIEPAVAEAPSGTRFQFLRQGYFVADASDSRPSRLVFNRIIGLKNTWASKAPSPTVAPEKPQKSRDSVEKGPTQKKGRLEIRAESRARNPILAEKFQRYQKDLGMEMESADFISSDPSLASFFDQALASHRSPSSVAKWLVNDLLGLLKDQSLDTLPFTGTAFGRFVALVDSGQINPAAAKTLLAQWVTRGGDPEALLEELQLQKRDDSSEIEAAVIRVLQKQSAEVARYRAGEKKLLGVLIGAAMREMQGAADPTAVRKKLTEKLG